MPGFYFPIMLDGVAAIKDSVVSTGWNPVSKIVGFISKHEQITTIQELKKHFQTKIVQLNLCFEIRH